MDTSAVWLYHSWHPGKFPDGLSLSFGLAIAVLHLRPLDYKKPYGAKRALTLRLGAPARRDVGARLQGHLAPLLINIFTGIEKQEEQKQEALRVLSQPF